MSFTPGRRRLSLMEAAASSLQKKPPLLEAFHSTAMPSRFSGTRQMSLSALSSHFPFHWFASFSDTTRPFSGLRIPATIIFHSLQQESMCACAAFLFSH